MKDRDQKAGSGPSGRRGRRFLLWLGRIAAGVVVLLLAGALFESVAEASDAKAYPPPGRLVDVGGYRLHIYCTGEGSPAVVIDAGLGDWSTAWGFVQPEVAQTTRICTYDRAGSGWSDAGPLPRDAAHFAKELHTLLHNADVPGPYVIVGHSMGGLTARVFAHEYASEVAGVVLIESMSPGQFAPVPAGAPPAFAHLSFASSLTPILARFGVVRLLVRPLGLIPQLPGGLQDAYVSRLVLPSTLQATADETQGLPAAGAQASAVKSFGGLPLIVLTGRLHTAPPVWQVWQTELLQLSTDSQQLFAENSTHSIETEEPQAAVSAIVQMVRQVRAAAGQ